MNSRSEVKVSKSRTASKHPTPTPTPFITYQSTSQAWQTQTGRASVYYCTTIICCNSLVGACKAMLPAVS